MWVCEHGFTIHAEKSTKSVIKKKKKSENAKHNAGNADSNRTEEVKIIVLPMVHKVQEEIILIPHIDFVIPNEFDVVELKVFLFPVLSKVILDLKQVLFVSILILQCFKTRG